MLLKLKPLILFCGISLMFLQAQAQQLQTLEAGKYSLKSGDKAVCHDFIVSAKPDSHSVFFGSYSYNLQESNKSTPSDIDSKCTFKESNKRTEGARETVLTRINQEVCGGKITSSTVSKATVLSGEIRVRHQIDNTEPYECLWIKK